MFKSNKIVKIELEMTEDEGDEGEREMCIDVDGEIALKSDDYDHVLEAEKTSSLVYKVFSNDMLRENILKHVIYPTSVQRTDRSNLCNVRLVQHSWLRTAGDIVRKNRDFVFHAELNKENSVDGTVYCNEKGKILNKMNLVLRSPVGQMNSNQTPTFALRVLPDFFRKENYQDLAECLEDHGTGLTDLDLSFPSNSSMTLTFHPFTLPKLIRLGVQFTDQRVPETATMIQAGQSSPQSVYPLQTFLNATTELGELQFKFTTSETLIPAGFDYIRLPSTIKYLFLDCPVKNQDLEILLKNDLPNLRHLRLFGTNNPYAEGLIFQILSKFKSTLRTLNLRGSHYHGRVRNTTLFGLPIMEKLETFTITSQTWELEEDSDKPINWESCLPKLKEMRLLHQTESLFRKWTVQSRYESVTRLFISLINTNSGGAGYMPMQEHPLTFNLARMQSLHLAFPNVVCLEISLCGSLTCGLKYMFMEMRNLQKLAITLKGVPPDQAESVHWDAVLIGVPPDMVTCLKRNPDFWPNFVLTHTDDNAFPSIRMLSDLRSLALVENFFGSASSTDAPGMANALISDLSFVFGFLKMQKLKHLLLSGRFKASASMSDQWKQVKGTVIHSLKRFSTP